MSKSSPKGVVIHRRPSTLLKVMERLVDVDLDEAQHLGEVTSRPGVSEPRVCHAPLALPELVVQIHRVHVPMRQRVCV